MGKRYTYFREPTGKPYRGIDGKHAPVHILALIGSTSTANAEGGVSGLDLFFQQREVALRSAVIVLDPDGEELNEHDAWCLAWAGIVEILKKMPGVPISPLKFLEAADGAASEFFRKPITRYVAVTSLSISDLPAQNIIIRGHRISAFRPGAGRYALPRVLTRGMHQRFSDHLESSKYRRVKISTEGRSVHEAIEKALNALDLLRGLWSLPATYGSWSMNLGGSSRKPLGVIHKGPVHTLHLRDGKPATEEMFWFDPEYSEDRPVFKDDGKWVNIEKKRQWSMRKLASLEYRQELEDLLIRYAGALDQENPDLAFLQMWGILERITDTVGAQYDETIKRAMWVFNKKSRPFVKESLEALRFYRNRYVHSGGTTQEADQVAYLLKSYLDPHLFFLVENPFRVSSIAEYADFLRLPTDVETLARKHRQVSRAFSLAKKWEKAENKTENRGNS